jgi:hypothetical protein
MSSATADPAYLLRSRPIIHPRRRHDRAAAVRVGRGHKLLASVVLIQRPVDVVSGEDRGQALVAVGGAAPAERVEKFLGSQCAFDVESLTGTGDVAERCCRRRPRSHSLKSWRGTHERVRPVRRSWQIRVVEAWSTAPASQMPAPIGVTRSQQFDNNRVCSPSSLSRKGHYSGYKVASTTGAGGLRRRSRPRSVKTSASTIPPFR